MGFWLVFQKGLPFPKALFEYQFRCHSLHPPKISRTVCKFLEIDSAYCPTGEKHDFSKSVKFILNHTVHKRTFFRGMLSHSDTAIQHHVIPQILGLHFLYSQLHTKVHFTTAETYGSQRTMPFSFVMCNLIVLWSSVIDTHIINFFIREKQNWNLLWWVRFYSWGGEFGNFIVL